MEHDKQNSNTLLSNTNVNDHEKLREYDIFIDKGRYHVSKLPRGYRKISVYTIFDVKHDGCHHAWVVAEGHLTEVPTASVHLGVVFLQGLRAWYSP